MDELKEYAEEAQRIIQAELEAEYCFKAKELNDLHQMYLNKMQSKLNDAIQHNDLQTVIGVYFDCAYLVEMPAQEKAAFLAYQMSDNLTF